MTFQFFSDSFATMTTQSFEKTKSKHFVRYHISSQIEQYIKTSPESLKKYNIYTLPGVNWIFENTLISRFSFLFPDKSFELRSFENKGEIYDLGKERCCVNFQELHNTKLNNFNIEYIYGQIEFFGKSSGNDIAWFDFCGNATAERIYLISETQKEGNLTYVTFCLTYRRPKDQPEFIKESILNGVSIKETITRFVEKQFTIPFKKVLSVEYFSEKSTMLTLGYHFSPNSKILSVSKTIKRNKKQINKRTNKMATNKTKVDRVKRFAELSAKHTDAQIAVYFKTSRRSISAYRAHATRRGLV